MYKKYIIKNGKRIGPYYYTSERGSDGKVKTVYLGREQPPQPVALPLQNNPPIKHIPHDHHYLLIALIFVALGFIFFLPATPQLIGKLPTGNLLTGLTILEGNQTDTNQTNRTRIGEETFIEDLSLTTTSDTEYVFTPGQQGELTSIQLSGEIKGEGTVTIYLDNTNTVIYEYNVTNETTIETLLDNIIKNLPKAGQLTGFAVLDKSFHVTDHNENIIPVTINQEDTQTIVTFTNNHINTLTFTNLEGANIHYREDSTGLVPPNGVTYTTVYGLDVQDVTYESATITATATAPYLYTCPFYDITLGICLSDWEQTQNLVVGQPYTITLNSKSVAYAEATPTTQTTPVTPTTLEPTTNQTDTNQTNQTNTTAPPITGESVITDVLTGTTRFTNECMDTCELDNKNQNSYKFIIIVDGVELTLFTIQYTIKTGETTIVSTTTTVDQADRPPLQDISLPDDLAQRLYNPNAIRGSSWVRTCDGTSCTIDLYPGPINIKDMNGNYQPFDQEVKVNPIDATTFTLNWQDHSATITLNEQQGRTLENMKTDMYTQTGNYEFAYYYNLTDLNTTPFIDIDSDVDIQYKGNKIILGDIAINFDDAIEYNKFTIKTEKKDKKKARVTLTKNYKQHGQDLGDSIEIDPIIELERGAENITLDGFVAFNDTNPTPYTRNTNNARVRFGLWGCPPDAPVIERGWVDFNTSLIPDGSVINSANMTVYITQIDDDLLSQALLMTGVKQEGGDYSNDNSGNEEFYNDIGNGTLYGFFVPVNNAYNTIVLNSSAIQDIEDGLPTNNFTVAGYQERETVSSGPICPPDTDVVVTRFHSENSGNAAARAVLTVNYASMPQVVLQHPPDNTNYTTVTLGETELNATITELDGDDMTVRIFASNLTNPGLDDLVNENRSVATGSLMSHNFTVAPADTTTDTIVLFHFDNRTVFGENDTHIYDFSGTGNNGTVDSSDGNEEFVRGKGKFAYAVQVSGIDFITLGDKDDLIDIADGKTYMAWLDPDGSGSGTDAFIVGKIDNLVNGFGILRPGSTDTLRIIHDLSGEENFANFFDATQHHMIHMAVAIESNGDVIVYKNGVEFGTASGISFTPNDYNFSIGNLNLGGGWTRPFQGFIDDFVLVNRTLTAEEVRNYAIAQGGQYCWYVNATDLVEQLTNMSEVRCFGVDRPPDVTTINLEPAPEGYTNDTLNCSYIVEDDVFNQVEVDVRFYKDGVLNETITTSAHNGTANYTLHDPKLQVKGEDWYCDAIASDISTGDINNTANTTIINSPPFGLELLNPSDGSHITNRTPLFEWGAQDEDNDSLKFTLNLTCYNSTDATACPSPGDNRLALVTIKSHEFATELVFFGDDGLWYNWSVNMTDSTNNSDFVFPNFNFTVDVLQNISLPTDNVDFGSLTNDQNDDTSDDSPAPFTIQNEGNIHIDINITANAFIFIEQSSASSEFQFKIDNRTEFNSFNVSRTTTGYTNVDTTTQLAIGDFNNTDTNDSAEIDINVTVPSGESAGAKSSVLTFTTFYRGLNP